MSKWKEELRDKLKKDLEDKQYYVGDNISLSKEDYIEYMIKIEGRLRKQKYGTNTGTD